MVNLILENFEEEILEASKPCVVIFKNEGCHLCRRLLPIIFKLRERYAKQFKFGIIDSSYQTELAELLEIDGVPTIFLFNNGNGIEIDYPENPNLFSGYSEKYLIDFLEDFLLYE